MIAEIHGAGFQNKGAELMLRTVVQEIAERLPRWYPAVDPSYGTYQERSRLGLLQLFTARGHVGRKDFASRFQKQKLVASILRKPFKSYGLVPLSAINAFIDISGFAYSDQWGARPIQDLARLVDYYNRHQKPVILMPQAFGPFEQQETRRAMTEVLSKASLVFARDRHSFDYLQNLTTHPDRLFQAPDITLFYPKTEAREVRSSNAGYVCVVPNARMLDADKTNWIDQYQRVLCEMTADVIRRGIPVRLLIHDTSGQDLKIAQAIHAELQSPLIEIDTTSDPLALKKRIAGSLFLIGSRFHSLVAAFASSVPVIGLGWSHKYEVLFNDFGCSEYILKFEDQQTQYLEKIEQLMDPSINAAYRQRIGQALEQMQAQNQAMWERVVHILGDNRARSETSNGSK